LPSQPSLFTWKGYDWTQKYPRIVDALASLRVRSIIVDGEAVWCGADGKSNFDKLHSYAHDDEVFLYVFDLLESNGEDHLIKNTPKVTGFLGSHKMPIQISEAEAAYILHQMQEGMSGRSLWSPSKWASRSTCRTAHSPPSTAASKRSTILDHGSRLPSRSLAVRRRLNSSLAKCKKPKPTFSPHLAQRSALRSRRG
jgi:hypothetical protein